MVDEFPVDLLAVLEALDHVINELLRHLILDLDAVIVRLDGDRVEVETLGGGGFVADFYGGIEVELSQDLLALGKLELRILVVGIQPRTLLEILDSILGFEDSGIGNGTTVISLQWRALKKKAEVRNDRFLSITYLNKLRV